MSKRQTKEITTPPTRIATTYMQSFPLLKGEESKILDRKITLAVDGFMTGFCEKTLRDRNKLSENASTIAENIIAIKREINLRLSYIKNTIQILSEFSRYMKQKPFKEISERIWIVFFI